MAHLTSAAVWTLDTSAAGLVNFLPVNIASILVTWKVASAGVLLLQEAVNTATGTAAFNPILSAKTLGASSAGGDQVTQQFSLERVFQNVWLTTATNIDSLYIYTR